MSRCRWAMRRAVHATRALAQRRPPTSASSSIRPTRSRKAPPANQSNQGARHRSGPSGTGEGQRLRRHRRQQRAAVAFHRRRSEQPAAPRSRLTSIIRCSAPATRASAWPSPTTAASARLVAQFDSDAGPSVEGAAAPSVVFDAQGDVFVDASWRRPTSAQPDLTNPASSPARRLASWPTTVSSWRKARTAALSWNTPVAVVEQQTVADLVGPGRGSRFLGHRDACHHGFEHRCGHQTFDRPRASPIGNVVTVTGVTATTFRGDLRQRPQRRLHDHRHPCCFEAFPSFWPSTRRPVYAACFERLSTSPTASSTPPDSFPTIPAPPPASRRA